jgi:hypothetical protein
MIRTCVHCGEDFDDKLKHNRKGKINECGACAKEPVTRYVGMADGANKSGYGIAIFRSKTGIAEASSVLKRQNAIGFNANVPVGNPASPLATDE